MLNPGQVTQCADITFMSDGYCLGGTLHIPPVNSPPVVIGSHGLLSSSESPKQLELALRCNADGIAFFRFDHRGCGKSQGDFSHVTTLSGRVNDLVNAIRIMREHPATGIPVGLFGSSLGGAACIAAFADQVVDALVTFAAPVRIDAIAALPQDLPVSKHSRRAPQAVSLRFDISNRLDRLHHVLVFHGDADSIVPYSNAVEIYQHAQTPKMLIRQKDGDHLMSRRHHQQEFVHKTVKWYKNCFRRGSNQSD